jgi:hypothetical protein
MPRRDLALHRLAVVAAVEHIGRTSADEAVEARRMLAHVLAELGGQCTVNVEAMDMVSETPWQISTKRLATPGGITQGATYTLVFRPEVNMPAIRGTKIPARREP